jgi:Type VI secretion system, TssC, VipB
MAEMQENQESQKQAGYKEREKVANPAELLQQSTTKLAKQGGFDLLEVSIEGVQNLNPEKKARKKIFLTESDKKKEREQLKKTLQLWHDLISESSSVSEMAEKAQQRSENADKLLKKNLATAVEETKTLERSYRSVAMFYKISTIHVLLMPFLKNSKTVMIVSTCAITMVSLWYRVIWAQIRW